MGKNLYETPRDKSKWNIHSEGSEKFTNNQSGDAKKARLEALKNRYKGKNK